MKTLKFKSLLSLILILVFFNISFSKKVTTAEFLAEHTIDTTNATSFEEIKSNTKIAEIKLNSTVKGEISSNSPVLVVDGEKNFPSGYTVYELKDVNEDFKIELRSLGNMMGFKKTIMFPLISVYDANGAEVNGIEIANYESRSPSGKYPYHIYSLWNVKIENPGNYYLLLISDNSATDDVRMHVSNSYAFSTGGFANLIGKGILKGYPIKRSPYGKYKLTIQ